MTDRDTMRPTSSRPQRTTLRDVADAAGVSTATASYVLAGRSEVDARARIADATADRVRAAAKALHYRVNTSARSTRTGRTGQVLLALTVSSDPWVQAVIAAANTELARYGIDALVLADGDWSRAAERQNPDAVFIDGVGDDPTDVARLAHLVGSGLPVIVLSSTLQPDGFDVISSQWVAGCRLSMAHLIGLGHRRIACLTVDAATPRQPGRAGIYAEEMAAADLDVPPGYQVAAGPNPIAGYEVAVELLSQPHRPTAIYCGSDYLAFSVLRAAHRLGISVPGELSVIGAGNTPDGRISTPALTTVGAGDEFGEIARLLRRRALEDPSPAIRSQLDWALIERESTDPPSRP